MASIYENSHVTIAATFARNSNDGLFSNRARAVHAKRLKYHPHLHVMESVQLFPQGPHIKEKDEWPLLTRAWVYQERRLSPRIIHYGKNQVYWQCQHHFASEDGCEDIVLSGNPDIPIILDEWREPRSFNWHASVEDYTNLKLTYETDRLPAIAAVAERMSQTLRKDDVYIAGVWKNSIISDMLWCSDHGHSTPSHQREAPSWSWVSSHGTGVSYFRTKRRSDTVELVSLDYTLVGAPYLGRVRNASVVLKAPTLTITDSEEQSQVKVRDLREDPNNYFPDILTRKYGPKFSTASLDFPTNDLPGLGFAPVNILTDYDLTTASPPFETDTALKIQILQLDQAFIQGVVLRSLPGTSRTYERFGLVVMHGCACTGKQETCEMARRFVQSLPSEELKIM